jgi:transcription elongation factor GreA
MLTKKREITLEHLKKAREMGDISENGYYKSAKLELGIIDRQLRKTAHLLKEAYIAQENQSETIIVGTKVTITNGKSKEQYTIVGTYESNPSQGTISCISPLGHALLGKKKGDVVHVQLPSSATKYTILSLDY